MHEEKMSEQQKIHDQTDSDNAGLTNEVSMLKEKLDKREGQLFTVKAERKKLQTENAKLQAELDNAQERLSIAQELEQIDMGQFNAMRTTNLEVAKKIEKFLD